MLGNGSSGIKMSEENAARSLMAMTPHQTNDDGGRPINFVIGKCNLCNGDILSGSDDLETCILCKRPLEFVTSGKPKYRRRPIEPPPPPAKTTSSKNEKKKKRKQQQDIVESISREASNAKKIYIDPEDIDRQKEAGDIAAINKTSGGKNDKAAALAAAILRGVTMRPSGKWQAQFYYAGKSRYIGVFETRAKATLAYEIVRQRLKPEDKIMPGGAHISPEVAKSNVDAARKAAFEGVSEKSPSYL